MASEKKTKAPGPLVKLDAASLKRWAAYFDRPPETIRQAVLEAGPNVLYVRRCWVGDVASVLLASPFVRFPAEPTSIALALICLPVFGFLLLRRWRSLKPRFATPRLPQVVKELSRRHFDACASSSTVARLTSAKAGIVLALSIEENTRATRLAVEAGITS